MASKSDIDTLLEKVTALSRVNEEIFARLLTSNTTTYTQLGLKLRDAGTQGYHGSGLELGQYQGYRTHHDPATIISLCSELVNAEVTATEVATTAPWHYWNGQNFVLKTVKDIFNDSINFKPTNIAELRELNSKIPHVAEKYSLFGPTPKAVGEVQLYLRNLESIQVELGKWESDLVAQQNSEVENQAQAVKLLQEIKKRAEEIGKLYDALKVVVAPTRSSSTYGYSFNEVRNKLSAKKMYG